MQQCWPQQPVLAESLLAAEDADCPADQPQSHAHLSGCQTGMEDAL